MIETYSNSGHTSLTLAQAKPGKTYRIVRVEGQRCRENLMRMGLAGGSLVKCSISISHGPVVVRHGRSDIAVGNGMAQHIVVEPAGVQIPESCGSPRGGAARGRSNIG